MSVMTAIQKSFGASRRKTAVLAVLVLVGLGVWIPPLLKGGKPAAAPRPPQPAADSNVLRLRGDKAAQTRGPAEARPEPVTLENLRRLVEERLKAGRPGAEAVGRNPFAMDTPSEEDLAAGSGRRAGGSGGGPKTFFFDPAASNPREAGLVLSATLKGKDFQGAVINREVYLPRQQVPRGVRGAYTVVAISDRTVRLSRGDKQFTLTMDNQEDAQWQPNEQDP